MNEDDEHGKVGLKRRLGLTSAVSMIVGTIIGSGIFITPGIVLSHAGSVWLSLSIWIASGFLSLLGAICYVELGSVIPISGGEYVYIKEAFGDCPAFIVAWVTALILRPAVGVITLAFAQYAITPFLQEECVKSPECYGQFNLTFCLISAVVLLFQCYVNSVSVSLTTKIQNVFTTAKVLSIGLIAGCGLYNLSQGLPKELNFTFEGSNWNFGSLSLAFYGGLWAFDGWNNLGYIAEELKNPHRNLPLAIFIAMPLVMGCYFMANLSYSTIMTNSEIMAGGVAITFGNRMLGSLAFLMPLSVCLSTYGAANGSQFVSGRLYYAAGKNGHLPRIISFIDVKSSTPSIAMICNSLLAIVYTLLLDIGSLVEFFSFTQWLFYATVACALIRLRYTKPDAPRPFKVPFLLLIVFLCAALFLIFMPIIFTPQIGHLFALGFTLLGLVFYFPFVKYERTVPGMYKLSIWIQILFQVVSPDTTTTETDLHQLEPLVKNELKKYLQQDILRSNSYEAIAHNNGVIKAEVKSE